MGRVALRPVDGCLDGWEWGAFGWDEPHRRPEGAALTTVTRRVPLPFPGAVLGCSQATVMAVVGALDVHTASLLRCRVATVRGRGGQLVLDIDGVVSCDLVGLGALEATRARAQARGGEVHLVAATGGLVARLFRMTGWSFAWPLYPDLDAALRAAHPPLGV